MQKSAYMSLGQNSSLIRPDTTEFQHQPITHQTQSDKQQMAMFKKFVRNIEIQQRKKVIQKTQQIKKELLEAQIAAKNFRSELLRPATQLQHNRQVRESHKTMTKQENTGSQKKITLQRKQKSMSTDVLRAKPQQILKLQVSTLKGQPYVSKDKLMKKPLFVNGNVGQKEKENRAKQPPKEFSGIRLRNLKLPELSLDQTNTKKQTVEKMKQNHGEDKGNVNNDQLTINKERQLKRKQKAKNKQTNLSLLNPVLKTFDTLYFGIQREKRDFQKMGKGLIELIKEKYWDEDNLQNQEVLDSFEDYLAGLVQAQSVKE